MSKSTIITIVVLIAILLLVGGFTVLLKDQNKKDNSDVTRSLITANEVLYTDLEGNVVSLDKFVGKVLVVNSWASWCPFCVGEIPDLAKLATEYKNRDVIVIAINRKEPKERAKSFLKKFDDVSSVNFVQDPTDFFYSSIGGFSMPETVFYDTDGNISTHKRGFMNFDEMRTLTEKAINETKIK